MVVLSFDDSVAESESELKMHVEIAGELEPGDPEKPIKAVVYWLNSHTGYFMAPSTHMLYISCVYLMLCLFFVEYAADVLISYTLRSAGYLL